MQRAKSRAFQIMMLVTVGLIMAVIPLAAFLTPDPEPLRIGLLSSVPGGMEEALSQRAAELDQDVEVVTYPDLESAEEALRDGEVGVVYTGSEIVWLEEESLTSKAVITGAASQVQFREAAEALGLTAEELAAALTPPDLEVSIVAPPDPEEEPRRVGALIGLILLYMSILIFGQFVALGVMEEKQNRVVEVVLSRVEPAQVLLSKVVGIGGLGLAQLVVLGAAIWFALNLIEIEGVSLPALGAEILASIVFWFLLGYTMYAVLYAALGSTVSRQEDLQSALILPVFAMLPGFFIAQVANEFPESPLVVFGSYFPLWSPLVMPVRAAVGAVAVWEVALAVVLVLIFSYLVMLAGARIYRGAVLQLGARVKLREAWRATG
jgi:ABC-2 type transport system permease protein